jgi:UDP-N-acetyl-D-galactosamine dehydrogenase
MHRHIAVVGLGYVGLPVAVAFGRQHRIVGFDINPTRVAELKAGHDRTGEVADADLAAADILYTDQVADLRRSDFFIVAVPTPVDQANKPDLTPLISASRSVARRSRRATSSSTNPPSTPAPPRKTACRCWSRSPA